MKSIYIHVPFCRSICYYCDFKRSIYQESNANMWLKRIVKDIDNIEDREWDTIYIGGGTPSCLTITQLEYLLKSVSDISSCIKEFTIESNMESLDKEKLELMKHYGINRISLGVQSLQDNLLEVMNRKHRKEDVFRVINMIHEVGIYNISVDMIYGFKEQSLTMWKDDLKTIAEHPYITHISLYSLTIDEGSIFYKRGYENCDNTMEALMYEEAISILSSYGYIHYEIANFSKPGYESLHNQTYWNYDDFLGIGVGASGKRGNIRYSVSGSLKDYLSDKEVIEKEILSCEDMMFEHIMMSLRLRKGLCISAFNKKYKCNFNERYKKAIKKELSLGHIMIEDDYIKTSHQGMMVLHDVLVSFMEEEE